MEIILIDKLCLTDRRYGYNISHGGDSSTWSDESKQKMHDSMMKRIEANGGRGLNYGKHFSEEARKHIAEAQKKIADIHRNIRIGTKLSPESIAKRTATRLANNGGVYTVNTTSKKVFCIETGEIIPSINELSRSIGKSPYLVTQLINKGLEHNGHHYIFYKGE